MCKKTIRSGCAGDLCQFIKIIFTAFEMPVIFANICVCSNNLWERQ